MLSVDNLDRCSVWIGKHFESEVFSIDGSKCQTYINDCQLIGVLFNIKMLNLNGWVLTGQHWKYIDGVWTASICWMERNIEFWWLSVDCSKCWKCMLEFASLQMWNVDDHRYHRHDHHRQIHQHIPIIDTNSPVHPFKWDPMPPFCPVLIFFASPSNSLEHNM